MSSYKELTVWQKSISLCEEMYKVTEKFPKSEMYGLVSQMRRCSVSIPSNIAEGQRRGSRAEFMQFLRIAFGSAAELETQLLIALRIKYLSVQDYKKLNDLLEEVLKMLSKLISSIK